MNQETAQADMQKMILAFPNQIQDGWHIAEKLNLEQEINKQGINKQKINNFNNIIVSAMGGSAWPAEILNDWLTPTIPFYINKTYNLPSLTNCNSITIFCSYSGNTEECLSCLNQAINKKLFALAITSGGELKKIAVAKNIPCCIIPPNLVPRMATGYFLAILAYILITLGASQDKSLQLLTGAKKIKPIQYKEKGKLIAQKIKNKIPIIYTSNQLQSLGYVWKIKFNENCKIPAFNHSVPELNHNELEGMAGQNNKNPFYFILLKNKDDDVRINKRIDITAEILHNKNHAVEIIELPGETLIEKILFALVLSDWVSYHLALEYNVNPVLIKTTEEFKRRME